MSRFLTHLTRERVIAVSLIAAWTTVWLGAVAAPDPWTSPEAALAVAERNPTGLQMYALASVTYGVLFVPALLGLIALVGGRGVALTRLAVGMIVIGLFGHCFEAAETLALVASAQGLESADALAALRPVFAALDPFTPLIAGFILGVPLLLAALWRAGLTSRWPLLALLVSFPIGVLGASQPFSPVWILGTALAEASVVWAAVDIARTRPSATSLARFTKIASELQPQT